MVKRGLVRLGALLREAVRVAWAAKVSSGLIVVVVAAMCVAAQALVGRRLAVKGLEGAELVTPDVLDACSRLSTVEAAHALSSPRDTTNAAIGPGGAKTPAWTHWGPIGRGLRLVAGREPLPGEAIVSVAALDRLGLAQASGALSDQTATHPIVGAYEASAPLEDLAAGVIVAGAPGEAALELRVLIDTASSAEATTAAVLGLVSPPDPESMAVDSPSGIAATAAALDAEMASSGRALLLLVLTADGFLVAAVTLADVLVHRRDLGRRRTLGATRADLTALVSVRALIAGAVGALLGCLGGWAASMIGGWTTPLGFALGAGTLATIVATLSALPPAAHAARLDPVAVLRTP